MAIPETDAVTAQRRAAAGEITLLDVREADEWAAGHAALAQHLPMAGATPASVPAGLPLVVVCRSGRRSGLVTADLVAAGLDAANLTGGMQAWAAAGLPVVTDAGAAGTVA